jgi:hypothetical protein
MATAALVISIVGACAALLAAFFAYRQARAAGDQATAANKQVKAAEEQARSADEHAKRAAKQSEDYVGALSAIAWREQVLFLHDRGLAPGQIRYIMHLEDGGQGYEGWNGCIDDIVRNIPRPQSTFKKNTIDGSEIMACDAMPLTDESCTGPCQKTLQNRGLLVFRATDSESPNQSAGSWPKHSD